MGRGVAAQFRQRRPRSDINMTSSSNWRDGDVREMLAVTGENGDAVASPNRLGGVKRPSDTDAVEHRSSSSPQR